MSCIFGGAELDLRNAIVDQEEVYLDVFILMGGLELLLPMDCEVMDEVNCFMGGTESKRRNHSTSDSGKKWRLVLTGSTTMGGVEINV